VPGIILGLLIGVATGIIQFFLLKKFTGAVSMGRITNKTVIFAITQFLFPFAILVICAFLLPGNIMWVGIGIGAALITCAVIKYINVFKSDGKKK